MTKVQKYFEDFILKAIKTWDQLEAFLSNPDIQKKFKEEELDEIRELFIEFMSDGEIVNVTYAEEIPDLKDEEPEVYVFEDVEDELLDEEFDEDE